jgi:hypothetical protein
MDQVRQPTSTHLVQSQIPTLRSQRQRSHSILQGLVVCAPAGPESETRAAPAATIVTM